MHKSIILTGASIFYFFGISHVLAVDDWALKSDSYSLPRALVEKTLTVRGFTGKQLPAEQKQALLRELFIRESLLQQQDKVPASALAELMEKLADQRRNQLAHLVLDTLSAENMPDFSERARELYEVRKQEQYQLPLRLRVRVLRQALTQDRAANANTQGLQQVAVKQESPQAVNFDKLQALLREIQTGQLDFEQAVLQYSDDPKRKLTGGDSFWFQRGQKPDFMFDAAQVLSAEQPLSDILLHQQHAYILQFIGRQEPVQQSFAEVKDGIIEELQAEYLVEKRQQLLTVLRDRFLNNTEIHPDFQ